MSQQSSPDVPLPLQLSRMITSVWVPQAIFTAAALGIPDFLAEEPKRSDELASAVGAHPEALHRLMRALVVLELCAETGEGAFRLTQLGAYLRSDSPDSLRSWVLLSGGRSLFAWAQLVDVVRTGESAPKLLAGIDSFDEEHLDAHPEEAAAFDKAMAEFTKQVAGPVVAAYDFSGIRKIVDVGGGYGAFLAAVLAAYPHMSGSVFDLPHCRDGATRLLKERRLLERNEFVAGSFFDSVPAGADAYLLKNIIHDWDDQRSIKILQNLRAAMNEGSRLLVVELILPERIGPSPTHRAVVGSDLNMLVMMFGGRERTEAEFQKLFEAVGLRISRVVPTRSVLSIIETLPL